jgi:hypothetical protein
MSAPDAFVPVNVNPVVFFVMLSALDNPVSSELFKSGVPGTVGAVVSIVTDKLPVAEDRLPDGSIDLALIEYVPAVKLRSIEYTPPATVAGDPTALPPL